jgi:hypothetical protein
MEEVIVHHLDEWGTPGCGDAVCMPQSGEIFGGFVSVRG